MPLVGYWPLNETSGSTAYDRSGQENHGTLNGGVTQGANGILGNNAYQLDGTDDYVETPADSAYHFNGGDFTISLWFKPENVSNRQGIALGRYSGNTDRVENGILVKSDGTIVAYIYQNNVAGPVAETGFWYNAVHVYREGDNYLYLNGTEYGPVSHSNDQTDYFNIGCVKPNSNHLDGIIGGLRVYNHALTPSEIQYLYQVGKRGKMITDKRSP